MTVKEIYKATVGNIDEDIPVYKRIAQTEMFYFYTSIGFIKLYCDINKLWSMRQKKKNIRSSYLIYCFSRKKFVRDSTIGIVSKEEDIFKCLDIIEKEIKKPL